MMGFNHRGLLGPGRGRFDYIGINRALRQPFYPGKVIRVFFKDMNEFTADDPAFFFRLCDAF